MVIAMFVGRWFVKYFSVYPFCSLQWCICSFGSLCLLFSPAVICTICCILFHLTAWVKVMSLISVIRSCSEDFCLIGIYSIVEASAEQRHSKYLSQYGFACLLLHNPYCWFLLLEFHATSDFPFTLSKMHGTVPLLHVLFGLSKHFTGGCAFCRVGSLVGG